LLSGDLKLFDAYIAACYEGLPPDTYWTTVLTNHDDISFENLTKRQRTLVLSAIDDRRQYEFRAGESTAQRLMSVLHEDRNLFEKAFKMQFEQPGDKVIYYGEELGMTNAQLNKRPLDTRLFVRQDFDWNEAKKQKDDPDSPYTFVRNLIQMQITSLNVT
jgi:glycosidase